MTNKLNTENLIKVLQHLGFKKYQAGKEIYFLPIAGKIKPMTKIKLKTIEALIEDKVTKPKEPIKPKTKKVKSE